MSHCSAVGASFMLTRDCLGAQVMRCADVGADLVRITVQGMQEAKACGKIRDRLFQKG